ncbi:hypothetical protein BHM03_00035646 [Ensete ventricosum]|nr:hypothetical protein BHM03_00035646 [Ensete ventricosum]
MSMVIFIVVNLLSAYNAIIDRPTLNKLRVIVSTFHRSMKFMNSAGVGEARNDPRESRRCYLMATTLPKKPRILSPLTDPREPSMLTLNPEPVEEVKEVAIDPKQPNNTLRIGSALSSEQQDQMVEFLRKNYDLFAEIVYPCIPYPNGEDEGGQASSSLAVSTRWISVVKLLQSDIATLAQREGGYHEVVAKAAAYQQ